MVRANILAAIQKAKVAIGSLHKQPRQGNAGKLQPFPSKCTQTAAVYHHHICPDQKDMAVALPDGMGIQCLETRTQGDLPDRPGTPMSHHLSDSARSVF